MMRAVSTFLAGMGLPIYPAGSVPDGTTYPYLTWGWRCPGFGGVSGMTIIGWFRDTSSMTAQAARAAFLDKAAALLPEAGVRLDFPGGMALIDRSQGDFLENVVDDADASVLGGCVRAMLRGYEG